VNGYRDNNYSKIKNPQKGFNPKKEKRVIEIP